MGQRNGFHKILNIPFVYNTVQRVFFHKESKNLWKNLIGDYEGKIILDIGCGPGRESVKFIGSKYIGIDISEEYINEAKTKYASNGDFHQLSIDEIEKLPVQNIDIVILKGVLHHLDDLQIHQFLSKIGSKLSKNAKIIASDPVFTENQNYVSKAIISMDRGKNVRTNGDYRRLTVASKFKVNYSAIVKQRVPPYQRHFMCLEFH